MAAKS
ncbi:hypothetical protein YPPY101_4526, partial [Yersinia pestis PY-101]